MKYSSKIELISKLNNKLNNNTKSNIFYIDKSKDVEKLLEIFYFEGQILSYKRKDQKYMVVVNSFSNDNGDKIKNYSNKYTRSFKYNDVIKVKSLLRSVYFHTNNGLLSLESLKNKKLGGIPLFKA